MIPTWATATDESRKTIANSSVDFLIVNISTFESRKQSLSALDGHKAGRDWHEKFLIHGLCASNKTIVIDYDPKNLVSVAPNCQGEDVSQCFRKGNDQRVCRANGLAVGWPQQGERSALQLYEPAVPMVQGRRALMMAKRRWVVRRSRHQKRRRFTASEGSWSG